MRGVGRTQTREIQGQVVWEGREGATEEPTASGPAGDNVPFLLRIIAEYAPVHLGTRHCSSTFFIGWAALALNPVV